MVVVEVRYLDFLTMRIISVSSMIFIVLKSTSSKIEIALLMVSLNHLKGQRAVATASTLDLSQIEREERLCTGDEPGPTPTP